VEFFCGLSSDFFGQMLRDELARSNAGSRYAAISGRPTTLAFVKLIDGQASYLFYDEGSAGRMLSEADLPALDRNVSALLFGGISLIPEPCGSAYEALMRREHERRVTMLDPNIRRGFIPDREKHYARMKRMIAMADIVKLSDEDLAWFTEAGSEADIAARWIEGGVKLVLVTKGSQGAVGYTKGFKVGVGSPAVKVEDTVGAGDTFNAGMLASLDEQRLLSKLAIGQVDAAAVERALARGVKAAAVTVSRAGANPPWRHELG
jgi:fructokinase